MREDEEGVATPVSEPETAPLKKRRAKQHRIMAEAPSGERMTIGQRIDHALRAAGYAPSGKTAHRLLQVSRSSLGRWMSGELTPKLENMEAIAQLTGFPVEWFYGGDDYSRVRHVAQDALVAVLKALSEGRDLGEAMATFMAPLGGISPHVRDLASLVRIGQQIQAAAGGRPVSLTEVQLAAIADAAVVRHETEQQLRRELGDGEAGPSSEQEAR